MIDRCKRRAVSEELKDTLVLSSIGFIVSLGQALISPILPLYALSFGDLSGKHGKPDGRLFVGTRSDSGAWTMDELVIDERKKLHEYLLAIGQDEKNELYVMSSDTECPSGSSGRVYRLVPPRE